MLTSVASQSGHIHSMQTGVVQVSRTHRGQRLLLFISVQELYPVLKSHRAARSSPFLCMDK